MDMPMTGKRWVSTILGAFINAVARLETIWHPAVLGLVDRPDFFP